MTADKQSQPRSRSVMKRQTSKIARPVPRSAADGIRRLRPRGREAVMAAVLDAATELFATRGPASVSVRDVATLAGVNHALVHRHFGSKQAVLQAVLERAASEMSAVAARIPDSQSGMERLFAASAERATYWRVLARAILDGENPHDLQQDFPTIHRLIELLQAEQRRTQKHVSPHSTLSPFDARIVVGTTSAVVLGWLVFEPFLLAATGLEPYSHSEVRQQVVQLLQTLVARAQTEES